MVAQEPTNEPIVSLIKTLQGDRSDRQLEEDCGGVPTRRTIREWLREPPKEMPTLKQIQGLSRGLRVKPVVIAQTWGIALGLWSASDWGQVSALPGTEELTPNQRTVLAALIHEFQAANTETK